MTVFFGLSKSFWFILRISVIISSVIRITPSNKNQMTKYDFTMEVFFICIKHIKMGRARPYNILDIHMILQWKSFLFAQNPVNWDENDTTIF